MSQPPMRVPAGFTQDKPFQPLGLIGHPNPFYYSTFWDDFVGYVPGNYTVTATGNGTIAQTANGLGGRVTFTTNSSTPAATDIVMLQPGAATQASFKMSNFLKMAWLARINAANNNGAYQLGIMQKTTTPATITDGMVATRVTSGTGWVFSLYAGSSSVGSVTIADTLSGYAAGSDMDIAMVYNGRASLPYNVGLSGTGLGDVLVYMGSSLVGQVLNQNTAPLNPIGRFSPTSLPTVVLSPTLAMQSGTAASTTAIFDFIYGGLER